MDPGHSEPPEYQKATRHDEDNEGAMQEEYDVSQESVGHTVVRSFVASA
jgi:hypothetical protein